MTKYEDLKRTLEGQEAIIHIAAETGTGQSVYEIERYTEKYALLLRTACCHQVFLHNKYLTLLGRPQLTHVGLSGN